MTKKTNSQSLAERVVRLMPRRNQLDHDGQRNVNARLRRIRLVVLVCLGGLFSLVGRREKARIAANDTLLVDDDVHPDRKLPGIWECWQPLA